jgi:hypothetical protein
MGSGFGRYFLAEIQVLMGNYIMSKFPNVFWKKINQKAIRGSLNQISGFSIGDPGVVHPQVSWLSF